MSWRRGLLFALINLAVAVPLIVREEARDWAAMTAMRPEQRNSLVANCQTARWEPGWIYSVEPAVRIVQAANLPAATVVGWRDHNNAMFWRSEAVAGRIVREKAHILIAGIYAVLIAIQWLVLGGIPSGKPWAYSRIVITVCAAFAVCLWAIPALRDLYGFPAMVAFGTWIVWFGVAVVTVVKAVGKAIAKVFGRQPHPSTP